MDIGETEKEFNFPINQDLLETATQAMEEWKTLRDRIRRIDDQKSEVSEVVYKRVKADYEVRLASATDLLLSKKNDLDTELKTLYVTMKEIETQLENHRHVLEEIKFRNTLGEFTEEEFRQKSKEAEHRINKFETVIGAVQNNTHRYESIFAGEEGIFASQETHLPEEDISEIMDVSNLAPAAHEVEPPTDESGYLIEEEERNYFGETKQNGPTDETLHGHVDDSQTARAHIETDEDEAAEFAPTAPIARMVVINGEDAGAAYPIKGTTSFGRAESNTIVVKDAKASRQHAQIQKHGGEYMLVDLNSSNGTYVNGEKVDEHVLSNGDEIMIGDMIYQFQHDNL
jgi:hypothetical protein